MRRDYPVGACTTPAVYWAPGTTPGRDGRTVPADPVAVSVRWQDKQEKYVKPNGEDAMSSAVVYLSGPVVAGGWLWLGDLADVDAGAQPVDAGARRIMAQSTSTRLRRPGALYKAWL